MKDYGFFLAVTFFQIWWTYLKRVCVDLNVAIFKGTPLRGLKIAKGFGQRVPLKHVYLKAVCVFVLLIQIKNGRSKL